MSVPYSTEPNGTLYVEAYSWDQKILHAESLEAPNEKYVSIERMQNYIEWFLMAFDVNELDFIKFMGITYDVNSCDLTLDVIARYQNTTGFNYLSPSVETSFHYHKYLAEHHNVRNSGPRVMFRDDKRRTP